MTGSDGMGILERINLLATNKGIKNVYQLSKATGIPYSTLDHLYRTNGEADIKLPTLRKLAEALGVSMEYLANGGVTGQQNDTLSEKAYQNAVKYDRLDSDGQSLVDYVIDHEIKRLKLDVMDYEREAQ